MPPAKKRTRSYDSARTRAAVLAQFRNVREAVTALTPEQLDGPTRLGEWTVRELAAHLTMVLASMTRKLAEPEPARRELALLDWPLATVTGAASIDEDTRAIDTADLPALFAETAERYEAAIAGVADERLVPTRFGAMTLADFLVTRTVELVVHTDDLNAATGAGVPFDRQALAACTRLLADALAAEAPGGAVEVRIPPYAVVQCVEGPRHTRGTPPNVVETDPLTWIRLATGRARWAIELDEARVSASGERADLKDLLPLMG
ncbi:maleylpyruvate isomerase family mycothiol-dependent enzyme [Streptomyces sp. NBC_00572]|uniref:maleylpyruvate isomerase family mycothiol-dependent enzyme n=1 Tax=Streptomyces sp. NBC_00572 TaxID=2903664 RepID=UPI00225A5C8D|nr:maleylpyruvate isomerase family mycothiol-dependent enzyme [Streptomyces sp. NBC_00572]MCX4982288.1 maleylpyruvate isomerase family mycothiol-dependent enzyme [Streptomyces sp. NBC_00572]